MHLSLGLEFEAIISNLIPQTPIPSNRRAQLSIVADAINTAGLTARPFFPRVEPKCTRWKVALNPMIEKPTPPPNALNNIFRRHFGIVLASPTFYTDNDDWKHETRTALDAVAQRVKWQAIRSHHLHVHVGGKDKFTLPQLKRLAMFICRFESALDAISPVHHIKDDDYIMSNRYNKLLKNLTIDEVYGTIQKVTNVAELVQVMDYVSENESNRCGNHDSKFFKVNFITLIHYNTISFRHHEGTVSADSAVHWVEFILRFVQFAIDATDDIIKAEGDTLTDLKAYVRLP